ncbi:putative Lysozyme [uncultured Spirochaetota bacterium]|jgi:membrane-bound lytic murein transglycosylase D|uniref:Putative Lysozyme n=1 Tax=uncultured Spirochaetota bacterium TaxID=460511 RepID=A0A652ZW11_9SPIR|nr:putative Lysozyme [uncultured Spirochaetota bacterium]
MKFSSLVYTGCLAVLVFFTAGSLGAYDPDASDRRIPYLPSVPEEEPALPDYTGPQAEERVEEEEPQQELPGEQSDQTEDLLSGTSGGTAGEGGEEDPGAKLSGKTDLPVTAIDPLLSTGILVDGLEYDIDMPWGHEEFEKLREFYLSAGGKQWLKAVMQRSLPYLAFVEEKIHELGLPRELLYLPIIESEYSPYAVSKSGATGIWQFMRNSISGYGLSISEWKDDRRDFMRSTTAALLKLKDNYQALGDWSLAIAAYNAGLGAVTRAVRNAKGESIDFWHLYESKKLPKESLAYVPKFLAISTILRYPELHGLEYSWGNTLAWEAIPLDRQVDIGLIAEKAGIDLDLFKRGNAELNYSITAPGKSHVLKVPAEHAETVRSLLSGSSSPLIRYDIYTVKSGDTLSGIAKRYSTPLSIVIDANPGIKPDAIRIGQRLIIPQLSAAKAPTSSNARAAVVFDSHYTIKKGDTLGKISSLYGINPISLAEANDIGLNSILKIGQRLKVPTR